MKKIPQMYFDTADWEQAFKTWKENLLVYGDQMQFVVSTHPYTSGYWIENIRDDMQKGERVYRGEQVAKLEQRIRAEIESARKETRPVKFIM